MSASKNKAGTVDFYGGQIKSIETDGEVSATGMHDKMGVLVVEIPIFGKAPDFQLMKGDVILKINDTPVNNVNYFIENKKIFDSSKVKSIMVWRNQKEEFLK